METIDALFTRLRITDQFNALKEQIEGKIGQLDATIASVPTLEAILKAIPEDPEETAGQTRDKLETLEGEDRLDISAIKGVDELEKKIDDKIGSIPRGGARASNSTRFTDLSAQTNGVLKVFSVPKGLSGVLFSSDFPMVLMEGNGFTLNANRTQLTMTTATAPSSGSQLLYQSINIFNV